MSSSPTSLDRLHDLSAPPEVPWWPPAPGWYVVLGLAVLLALTLGFRRWSRWRANAYRRAAMRELSTLESGPEIATLLRRTALAIVPRERVASMHGTEWLDWLSAQARDPMPDEVRRQLTGGIYAPPGAPQAIDSLRTYAGHWISRHEVAENTSTGSAPSTAP